jgi:serine/threonine protein kinase
VVKIYDDFEAERQYNNETNMFRRLTQVDSSEARIIQFYGSFVQDGVFHVLLQYANGGTLEEYFENISPPRRRADMARFWSAMLNLIRAVHKIHGTSFDQDEKRKGYAY